MLHLKTKWNSLKKLLRDEGISAFIRHLADYLRYQVSRMEKIYPQNILLSVSIAFKKDVVIAWWYETKMPNATNNFGDALSPIMIKWLSGKEPVHAKKVINFTNKPVYSVIGSILELAKGRRLMIWGSGFIQNDGRTQQPPEKVFALRGPLTRKLILDSGIDCPEIYGDPALLCPIYYHPMTEKKYKLGIIPHHNQKNNPLLSKLVDDPNIILIDVQSGVYKVIDEINACECVASSSLHGIIVADAYHIPSLWISPSDKVSKRGGFKFKDYFMSVGREVVEPFVVTEKTTTIDILNNIPNYTISIDLHELLDACPFKETNNL